MWHCRPRGSNVVPFWLWLIYLLKDYNILPRKELHLSLWVAYARRGTGNASNGTARLGSCNHCMLFDPQPRGCASVFFAVLKGVGTGISEFRNSPSTSINHPLRWTEYHLIKNPTAVNGGTLGGAWKVYVPKTEEVYPPSC